MISTYYAAADPLLYSVALGGYCEVISSLIVHTMSLKSSCKAAC